MLAIADSEASTNVDFLAVIVKVGPIDPVHLKSGQQKLRRKVLVVDDCKLSIVICFWSDRHLEMLKDSEGKVIAVNKARVSSYYHKSLNASEDSHVCLEPDGLEEVAKMKTWYAELKEGELDSFHPLSGNLDVVKKEGTEAP